MKKILFAGYATLDIIDNKLYLGGAAGAMSINASFLGVKSYLLAILAKDINGEFYLEKLKKAGVDVSLCVFAPKLPTCIIKNPHGQGSKRIWSDNGANNYLSKLVVNKKKLKQFAGVFLANCHPIPAEKVAENNPANLFYIPGPQTILKRNYIKSSILKKTRIVFGNEEETPFIFAKKPFLKGVETVVETRGKEGGAIFLKDGKKIKFNPPEIKKIIDATGAGDSFALGFGLAILNGKSVNKAVSQGKQLAKKALLQKGGLIFT